MAVCVSGADDFENERPAESGRGPQGASPGEPTEPAGSMGDPVTPHALITSEGPKDFRYLICGVDTLDLGLYVEWEMAWPEIQPQLMYQLELSANCKPGVWRHPILGAAIVTRSSKRNYRYHVTLPDCHLFIADMMSPKGFPNVYASPTAKSL